MSYDPNSRRGSAAGHLRIPPANRPDERERFWLQMAQHFAAAEAASATRSPVRASESSRGAPDRPAEWRIPDLVGAFEVFKKGFEMPGHNDESDALRHAETARLLSEKLGPALTDFLGRNREYLEALQGQPRGETAMDINDNAEGVAAYRERRPVNVKNLQTSPGPNSRGAGRRPNR